MIFIFIGVVAVFISGFVTGVGVTMLWDATDSHRRQVRRENSSNSYHKGYDDALVWARQRGFDL